MTKGRSRPSRYQRDPARDAAFREAMDAAKDRRSLSDVVGRHTKLRSRGKEKVGLCPFHQERTPSFEVNDAKGTFYCHGCGAAGDHFTILTRLEGLTFRAAYEALTNETYPDVPPEQRAQRLAEDAAVRAASIDEARGFWSGAIDVAGTPADRYLRQARGITGALAPSLRFGMVPASKDDDGRWRRAMPALLGEVTVLDDFVAIQRVFLAPDGSGKANMRKPKLTLGRFVGGAVKMGNRRPDPTEIIVTEGLEDGISLAQELPGAEVWSALGTANLRMLQFPDTVTSVVIAGQNDEPGRVAADAAATAYLERGYVVRAMWPAAGFKDWNDQLRGIAL